MSPADFPGIRGRLTPNAALAPYTWFRVGGPAELLFQPTDADDLAEFLQRLGPDVPVTVIGVGSNLLVRDGGVPGVVVRLSAKGFGHALRDTGNRIRAGAALPDKRLAAFALEQGIGGFAFFHGIPGTIGGALRMNAGANGVETKDILVEATGISRDGTKRSFTNAEMKFVYRNSGVDPSVIFTSARCRGVIAAAEAIRARMDEVQTHRETAQPIREKTGGSTFQNPPGQSAWKLIDAAGCRGLRVGGAGFFDKHANFVENNGRASTADVLALMAAGRRRVHEHCGVVLEPEVQTLGDVAWPADWELAA